MDKINQRLQDYNQRTKILCLSNNSLSLNSGLVLYNNDANRFIKRVMNTKIVDWVKNIDKLLSGEISETEIKKISFSVGGKACQQKHGEKIKKNLNMGIPWNKNKKGLQTGWSKGLTKETDTRVAKLAKFGEKNPMFGKKLSDEHRDKQSKKMKQKIFDGEFTPNSNNRNTHWHATYDNKRYRSSWEAWYQYLNPNAEYETLRIEYEIHGKTKIYIVDFIDHNTKTVIEVKPIELCSTQIFKSKIHALNSWAVAHGYTMVLATKQWLVEQTRNINYELFDENTAKKIRKVYEISKKNRN